MLRPPSSVLHTWSMSGPCSRYSVGETFKTWFSKSRGGVERNWSRIRLLFQFLCILVGMDPLAGSVQCGTAGLWWPRGGLTVSGGHSMCHQDRLHLQHAGLVKFYTKNKPNICNRENSSATWILFGFCCSVHYDTLSIFVHSQLVTWYISCVLFLNQLSFPIDYNRLYIIWCVCR